MNRSFFNQWHTRRISTAVWLDRHTPPCGKKTLGQGLGFGTDRKSNQVSKILRAIRVANSVCFAQTWRREIIKRNDQYCVRRRACKLAPCLISNLVNVSKDVKDRLGCHAGSKESVTVDVESLIAKPQENVRMARFHQRCCMFRCFFEG